MKQILGILALCVVFLASFATAALASTDSVLELAKPVFDAVMAGNYAYAAALALVLSVAAARRYGGGAMPFLRTDAGGALLALGGSFAGALATSLGAGATISWGLMWSAAGIAVAAAGGYSLIKRLIVTPFLEPLAARGGKLGAVLGMLLWVFRSNPVIKAEAAGNAAVLATPSTGATGIVGEPEVKP